MKKISVILLIVLSLIMMSCAKRETVPLTDLQPITLKASGSIEDNTDLGVWLITVEVNSLKEKGYDTQPLFLKVGEQFFVLKINPLNEGQLFVLLPECFDRQTIEAANIIGQEGRGNLKRESDDIVISSVYIQKDGTYYEITLEDYLLMKNAKDPFVYQDDVLLRPTHVRSSEGYAYTMKYYYDARQVASEHTVEGAFTFLKSRDDHFTNLIFTENPYKVKIVNNAVQVSSPDTRDRVWQLGEEGALAGESTFTYDIINDSNAETLTLKIKEANLPQKYSSHHYGIQFNDDATVCLLHEGDPGIYEGIVQYATTSNVALVRNARFSEVEFEDGSQEHPWLIDSIEELAKVGSGVGGWELDKYYRLNRDLDFQQDESYENAAANKAGFTTGTGWVPIGDYFNSKYFTGQFDGDHHSIDNFYINNSALRAGGLFSALENATLTNLTLGDVDIYIGSGDYNGSLVGFSQLSFLDDLHVSGEAMIKSVHVGGVLGYVGVSEVSRISFEGTVTSEDSNTLGGLVGYFRQSSLFQSYSTGSFTVNNRGNAGGLLGQLDDSTMQNCYTDADVSGTEFVGGVLGSSGDGTITNTYSAGTVDANSRIGGFMGRYTADTFVTDCFWRTYTDCPTNDYGYHNDTGLAGNIDGVSQMTDTQMKAKVNFTNWQFVTDGRDIWNIEEGISYPYLENNEQVPHPGL